ncbi:MAG: hypothetical protein HZA94_01465 [Candidatus Vogelbacteria bacterium]|nr:hypothetical protein [Candidatus Vogelbacteria bacterium]
MPRSVSGIEYLVLSILLFSLFFFINPVFAAEVLPNTGLIQDNIWFSKDPFYVGDRIRIYSVIGNGSDKDLRGDINFYDGDSLICNTNFFVLSGRITESWCDWGVSYGAHNINVKIFRVKGSSPGTPEMDMELSSVSLGSVERVVKENPVRTIAPKPSLAQGVMSDELAEQSSNNHSSSPPLVSRWGDSFIASAINKVKDIVFGTEEKEDIVRGINKPPEPNVTRPKSDTSLTAKNKKELALGSVEKIKEEVIQIVASTPVLDNTASVYTSLGRSVLDPLNAWLDSFYSSVTKDSTNKPLLYFAAFLRFIFRYIIFTPYFFTVALAYFIYKGLRYCYRRYRER